MQATEAIRLQKNWEKENNDKVCDHPSLDKEFYLGTRTGDYVCTTCGESGPGKDWPNKKKNAAQKDTLSRG